MVKIYLVRNHKPRARRILDDSFDFLRAKENQFLHALLKGHPGDFQSFQKKVKKYKCQN